jgi:uncharacterized iron-regulated protein
VPLKPPVLPRPSLWLAAALALCAGCRTAPPPPPEDPLLNRIFQSSDSRELTKEELFERLVGAQVIYLGEKHDNPRHHELELAVARELVERGRRPALGFEFFSVEQTSLLMSYATWSSATHPGAARGSPEDFLRSQLGWGEEQQQNWAFYGPLLEFAREQGLPVFGADLSWAIRTRIVRVGIDGLTNVERHQLSPTGFHHPVYEKLMRQKLAKAHCGLADDDYIDRLYQSWVARNDAMAMAITEMLAQRPEEPVLVVLGASHVQYNMGVYERVEEYDPGIVQVNLGFREVAPEPRPVADYLQPLDFDGTRFPPDHEIIWFSPRFESEIVASCEAMRRHFGREKAEEPVTPQGVAGSDESEEGAAPDTQE